MARSILGLKPTTETLAPALSRSTVSTALSGPALQARLRQKRSSAYVQAMTQLDAGGHVHSPVTTQALVEAIRNELPEVDIESLPLGIVSRCYLGAPYEVHTLDCSGSIIQHYKTHQGLPALLERARGLALHPGYAFIEVYSTRLIAVGESGQTALIDL
ncbi:hypothetical protein [Comamonas composti]|uniref:hypothetical protein n=1 Tax=Comamonas composti TaxID=408558 RepID=UPI00040143F6|nr:hypothetical protein [Comamonas composti]